MRLIDADSLSEKIQTIIGEEDWKTAMQYMIDCEDTVIIESEESIPIEFIEKWGKRSNRTYHVALLLRDWEKSQEVTIKTIEEWETGRLKY